MITKSLNDLMRRAKDWPEDAQEELARLAREIETELKQGAYRATPAELLGIDRGLSDSDQGKFATDSEVEAVIAKHGDG